MTFSELDQKIRAYESLNDLTVLPGMYMVARLDGRGFTRLTKETHTFEKPFDERFRDLMVDTTKHLMSGDWRILFGYTQSDEISLAFHKDADLFGRKLRKLNSVLAGEASATFSLGLGDVGVFDCRVSQFPSLDLVADYFRWRNEDAHRNALNAHCYWALRSEGTSAQDATARLNGLSVADKNELLYKVKKLNFNDVPLWQRRGIGMHWEQYTKEGLNPVTGESVPANRNRLMVDMELPMKDAYSEFVKEVLDDK